MKEKYLYIFLLFVITGLSAQAQTAKNNSNNKETVKTENVLEKIQIYPNPVVGGKIYITSEGNNSPKQVELYDMLGKKVMVTEMTNYQKELNVNSLKAGVYILKISDKTNSITRKIIIK